MHDLDNPAVPLSRRTLIRRIGWGSAAILASASVVVARNREDDAASASRAGSTPEDDDALLARIVSGSEPFIPRRETSYRLTRTVPIAGGKTVLIEPGTRIVWAGPVEMAGGNRPVAVFEAMGDNVTLAAASDGEAFIQCQTPSVWVYAAVMEGRSGFRVEGIAAHNCQHVWVNTSARDYGAVRTQGPGSNIARDVRVSGGGASFESLQVSGNGACLLSYVAGAHVSDVHYENAVHGIQWWGGDSGLLDWQNGMRANERKCSDLLIERVSVRNAGIGGIWGSMGREITVRDCQVEECHDVGFDPEGCDDVTFERCTSRNGHNGCFAAFFLNDGIRFVDCHGIVDDKAWPLFRTYNVTQSNAENRNIAVEGGHFECLDPTGPGTMDCASGPVRELAITGARLENVRIDTFFLNMHRTRIADNELVFPRPLPSVPAIRAGGSQSLPGAVGSAVVENNRIRYTAPRAAAAAAAAAGESVAIEIVENDFNASATSTVSGNIVSGPFAVGIALVNASGNAGVVPAFEVSGNRFEGLAPSARLLSVRQQTDQAQAPTVRWDDAQTRDGRAVGRAQALGESRLP